MDERYTKWIQEYCAKNKRVRGLCADATTAMKDVFPELRRTRGHVLFGGQHWWCVAPDGTIVDPTARQFERPLMPTDYIEFDESKSDGLPTGKCMDCGGLLYYGAQFCNAYCARSTIEYLDGCVSVDLNTIKYNPDPEDLDHPMVDPDWCVEDRLLRTPARRVLFILLIPVWVPVLVVGGLLFYIGSITWCPAVRLVSWVVYGNEYRLGYLWWPLLETSETHAALTREAALKDRRPPTVF